MIEIESLNSWIPASIALISIILIGGIRKSTIKNDTKTKPKRTLILELGNLILKPMFLLLKHERFQPLNLEVLKKKAMEQTNLTDLGDWDERPFRETIEIDNKVNYSPVGKFLM